MKSALKIFKDISVHDYQMSGYFNNQVAAVPLASSGQLLPFFTSVESALALTVTEFKLQYLGTDSTVITSHNLTNSWIAVTQLSTYLFEYTYLGAVDILATLTSYDSGIYRYSFKLGASQYYSDTFEINDFKALAVIGAGDFDAEDLNEDFY